MLDTLSLKMCDPFDVLDFKVLQPSPELDGWWEVLVSDRRTGDTIGNLTVRNGEYGDIDARIGETEHDLSEVLGWWVADYWRSMVKGER